MKAKKIAMFISMTLFLLGLLLAFLFTVKNGNIFANKWEQLYINLLVGISTGGLIALLIEIPLFISNIGVNKHLLKSNGHYTYTLCARFTTLIDNVCQNEKELISKDFCAYFFQLITQFLIPLMSLDPHMFFCSCRRKKINHFKSMVNTFLLSRDSIDSVLKIKISELERAIIEKRIQLKQNGSNDYLPLTTTSKDVKYELQDIKNQILPLCASISDTMNLCLSKKELQIWQDQVQMQVRSYNINIKS